MILSQYLKPIFIPPYINSFPSHNHYQPICNMKKIGNYSYDITKQIGHGSYSEVYLGHNNLTKELVAVKVIDSSNIRDDFLKSLISNEIETMKQIKHQNVVRLLEVYETTNHLYLILEYCESGDLRDLLNKHKVLPEKQAINILFQIVKGYKKLLKHNIIHRDLKPENILIHQGLCKITDFGFAIQLHDLRQQIVSVPVGTVSYCSPQIISQAAYTNKCDVWSLGILFYEMLFGTKPWPNNYSKQLFPFIKFPKNIPISSSTAKFLFNALQINENERIDWNDVLKHKLFKDYDNKLVKQSKKKNKKLLIQSEVISGGTTTRIEESARSPSSSQEIETKENYKVKLQRLKKTLRKINSTVNSQQENIFEERQKTYREKVEEDDDA